LVDDLLVDVVVGFGECVDVFGVEVV